jgi:DNA polymerase
VSRISEVAKLTKYLRDELGAPIADLTKVSVASALENDGLDYAARELLEIRKEAGRSSTSKYKAMINRMDSDDRVRELVVYHGAHPGRWAGRGIQIQNFPKGSIKDPTKVEEAIQVIRMGNYQQFALRYSDPMDVLASCLRGMLCAAPGYTLFGADYAQIEARFLLWLCGETEGVEMFRRGESLYSALASEIYGFEVNKHNHLNEYALGKAGILGAGYQMGPDKFFATCRAWGIEVSQEMAERTINAYRSTYRKVKASWYWVERAAKEAVRSRGKTTWKSLVFRYENKFLTIELPSGRKLHYYDPQIKPHSKFDKDSLTYMGLSSPSHKWDRQYTYGGKLVENIVQGACRDIMAEAMIRLERVGYPLVLTVHDELVAEVPTHDKDLSLKCFCDKMARVPRWAKGLPIEVEGWEGQRFRT